MNELDLVPGNDENTLDAEHYHLIVSPALQVAAELAAARGDADLYNDMASMLTLRAIIQCFGERLLAQDNNATPSIRDAIAQAPDAACAMVLRRGDIDQQQLRECLWALGAAQAKLAEHGVLDAGSDGFATAWNHLHQGRREVAIAQLKFAAGQLVTAIDQWERLRDAADNRAES